VRRIRMEHHHRQLRSRLVRLFLITCELCFLLYLLSGHVVLMSIRQSAGWIRYTLCSQFIGKYPLFFLLWKRAFLIYSLGLVPSPFPYRQGSAPQRQAIIFIQITLLNIPRTNIWSCRYTVYCSRTRYGIYTLRWIK
jgi:hypothetical protein